MRPVVGQSYIMGWGTGHLQWTSGPSTLLREVGPWTSAQSDAAENFYLTDWQPAWPTVRTALGAQESERPGREAQPRVDDGRPPSFLGLFLRKLQPQGNQTRTCRHPGICRKKGRVLRASQVAKGHRENSPLAAQGGAACPHSCTAHHFLQTPAIQIRGLWLSKDLLV